MKTRYLKVVLLRYKDKAFTAFKEYKNKCENILNKRIVFNTNNIKEYINKQFTDLLSKSGITIYNNPLYTKENLSIIKRINLTIINKARALLFYTNLPNYL